MGKGDTADARKVKNGTKLYVALRALHYVSIPVITIRVRMAAWELEAFRYGKVG